MGAAKISVAGPGHLTFTASEGVIAALAFNKATIVPVHFEGWAHFTESRQEISSTFRDAGMEERLRWPTGGKTIEIDMRSGG